MDVFRDEWLNRSNGVTIYDGKITSITTLSGKVFNGRVFIDCTYEGDLMASSGISYFIGRESNDKYGESLSGSNKER